MKALFIVFFTISFLYSFSQEQVDSIDIIISEKIESMPEGFAISIALIQNGSIGHIGIIKKLDSLAYQDLSDSLFEIGSITKVFTSTLLANEVVEGNLQLIDSINEAFFYDIHNNIELRYQDLANHTSGLPRLPSNIFALLMNNKDNPYSEYSKDLLDEYLKEKLSISNTDNPKYAYSNLGAGILAYSLESHCDKPFEELLKERVFDTYNMNHTAYGLKTSFVGLDGGGKKASNWQFNALKGAGGLVSSASDLSLFLLSQFDEGDIVLGSTRQETFSVSDNLSIGLGWHIINPNTKNQMYWHNGGTGGFTSSMAFKTSTKTGVVILSNISAFHSSSKNIDELCYKLMDLIQEKSN